MRQKCINYTFLGFFELCLNYDIVVLVHSLLLSLKFNSKTLKSIMPGYGFSLFSVVVTCISRMGI